MSSSCPFCGSHVSASDDVPHGGPLYDAYRWLKDNTDEDGVILKTVTVTKLCCALGLPEEAVDVWVLDCLAAFGYIIIVEDATGDDVLYLNEALVSPETVAD